MAPLVRNDTADQAVEILAPGDRHRSSAKRILEHQRPTDSPGHELAHCRVGVGVSAACDRDHGCELGVAQARECTANGGYQKGSCNGGARRFRRRCGGANEQSRADDCAHAQRDEAFRRQSALQIAVARLVEKLAKRFLTSQIHEYLLMNCEWPQQRRWLLSGISIQLTKPTCAVSLTLR